MIKFYELIRSRQTCFYWTYPARNITFGIISYVSIFIWRKNKIFLHIHFRHNFFPFLKNKKEQVNKIYHLLTCSKNFRFHSEEMPLHYAHPVLHYEHHLYNTSSYYTSSEPSQALAVHKQNTFLLA